MQTSKDLLLSEIRNKQGGGKEFYSQTNTLVTPIEHVLDGDEETYYRLYTGAFELE